MSSLPAATASPAASAAVAQPTPTPAIPVAILTTSIESPQAMSLAAYLGILLMIFLTIPFLIIIVRRYRLHDRFVWIRQRLLTRVPFDKLKGLMLTNAELSKRPFSQQLEAYLYSQTNWGYVLDITQAFLSLVSVGLFIANSYSSPIQQAAGLGQPLWSLILEFLLTIYFACDWALRFYLAHDRLRFYFSALSLLDFLTIVPGLLSIAVAENKFDSQAWVVASTLRVFRIFRVVRMMRVVTLAPGSSLQRQIGMLAVTVLSMVFAAAGIYQIVESTADRFMPFHKAMLYMTIIVIGRPPVPTDTTEAVIFVTIAIMVSASVIPAFVAELARLYFESQGHETYKSDPSQPHVIVCGDINTSRLKALLAQFFHKSRDAELVCPMVVLAEHKYEGPLRSLIEQSRYAGSVNYIRGSARRPADLKRAGVTNASTVLVLCNRMMADPNEADAEVVASCLAIKSVNRKLRVLAQLRRPRSADHLMVLPGWKEHDRTVALASLSMTLVGVGSVIPGLPTLLTNLIHQGNKSLARSAHPRRRQFTVRKGALVPLNGAGGSGGTLQMAGMLLAGQEKNWYAWPLAMVERMVEGFARMSYNLYLAAMPPEEDPNRRGGRGGHGHHHHGSGGKHGISTDRALYAHIFKPLSPVEEYSMGFAQEMFAFAVTPGLAGRTFGAAARMAYLRYGVLLIGARIPMGMQLFTGGKSGAYNAATAAAAAQAAANFNANQATVSGATGANLAAAAAAAAKSGNGPAASSNGGAPTKVDPSDISYSVLLFPCDLILQPGMFVHAIAFDAIDLATLLQGTGGEAALRGTGFSGAAAGPLTATVGPKNGSSVLSNAAYYQSLNQNTIGAGGSSANLIAGSPLRGSHSSTNLALSPPATPGAALHAGGMNSAHNDSTALLHPSSSSNDLSSVAGHQAAVPNGAAMPALYDGALDVLGSGSLSFAAAAGRRHNRAAAQALSVPWCFCEQEEECSEMVVSLMDSHDTSQRNYAEQRGIKPELRVRGLIRGPCNCGKNELWAVESARQAQIATQQAHLQAQMTAYNAAAQAAGVNFPVGAASPASGLASSGFFFSPAKPSASTVPPAVAVAATNKASDSANNKDEQSTSQDAEGGNNNTVRRTISRRTSARLNQQGSFRSSHHHRPSTVAAAGANKTGSSSTHASPRFGGASGSGNFSSPRMTGKSGAGGGNSNDFRLSEEDEYRQNEGGEEDEQEDDDDDGQNTDNSFPSDLDDEDEEEMDEEDAEEEEEDDEDDGDEEDAGSQTIYDHEDEQPENDEDEDEDESQATGAAEGDGSAEKHKKRKRKAPQKGGKKRSASQDDEGGEEGGLEAEGEEEDEGRDGHGSLPLFGESRATTLGRPRGRSRFQSDAADSVFTLGDNDDDDGFGHDDEDDADKFTKSAEKLKKSDSNGSGGGGGASHNRRTSSVRQFLLPSGPSSSSSEPQGAVIPPPGIKQSSASGPYAASSVSTASLAPASNGSFFGSAAAAAISLIASPSTTPGAPSALPAGSRPLSGSGLHISAPFTSPSGSGSGAAFFPSTTTASLSSSSAVISTTALVNANPLTYPLNVMPFVQQLLLANPAAATALATVIAAVTGHSTAVGGNRRGGHHHHHHHHAAPATGLAPPASYHPMLVRNTSGGATAAGASSGGAPQGFIVGANGALISVASALQQPALGHNYAPLVPILAFPGLQATLLQAVLNCGLPLPQFNIHSSTLNAAASTPAGGSSSAGSAANLYTGTRPNSYNISLLLAAATTAANAVHTVNTAVPRPLGAAAGSNVAPSPKAGFGGAQGASTVAGMGAAGPVPSFVTRVASTTINLNSSTGLTNLANAAAASAAVAGYGTAGIGGLVIPRAFTNANGINLLPATPLAPGASSPNAAASSSSSSSATSSLLSPYSNHILVCGATDKIGLLMRALFAPSPPLPKAYMPGLPAALSAQAAQMQALIQALQAQSAAISPHAANVAAQARAQGHVAAAPATTAGLVSGPGGKRASAQGQQAATTPVNGAAAAGNAAGNAAASATYLPIPTPAGANGNNATTPSAGAVANSGNMLAMGGVHVVVLCPTGDRPSELSVNNMHAGSARWLSKITWVNGNPSDMGDLLRAGVETARAAVVLSTRRNADSNGNDNLGDDVDAIIVASSIYKLNPRLHIMTEVVHGPHASYLRPAGNTLIDAEESATAFVASVRAAAELRLRAEEKQRRRQERQQALLAATAAASAVGPNGTIGAGTMAAVAGGATNAGGMQVASMSLKNFTSGGAGVAGGAAGGSGPTVGFASPGQPLVTGTRPGGLKRPALPAAFMSPSGAGAASAATAQQVGATTTRVGGKVRIAAGPSVPALTAPPSSSGISGPLPSALKSSSTTVKAPPAPPAVAAIIAPSVQALPGAASLASSDSALGLDALLPLAPPAPPSAPHGHAVTHTATPITTTTNVPPSPSPASAATLARLNSEEDVIPLPALFGGSAPATASSPDAATAQSATDGGSGNNNNAGMVVVASTDGSSGGSMAAPLLLATASGLDGSSASSSSVASAAGLLTPEGSLLVPEVLPVAAASTLPAASLPAATSSSELVGAPTHEEDNQDTFGHGDDDTIGELQSKVARERIRMALLSGDTVGRGTGQALLQQLNEQLTAGMTTASQAAALAASGTFGSVNSPNKEAGAGSSVAEAAPVPALAPPAPTTKKGTRPSVFGAFDRPPSHQTAGSTATATGSSASAATSNPFDGDGSSDGNTLTSPTVMTHSGTALTATAASSSSSSSAGPSTPSGGVRGIAASLTSAVGSAISGIVRGTPSHGPAVVSTTNPMAGIELEPLSLGSNANAAALAKKSASVAAAAAAQTTLDEDPMAEHQRMVKQLLRQNLVAEGAEHPLPRYDPSPIPRGVPAPGALGPDSWAITVKPGINTSSAAAAAAASSGSATPALTASSSTESAGAVTSSKKAAEGSAAGAADASTDAAAPTAAAPSDLFGAPAFAAGRAFSAATIDALLCEAHFAPHLIFIIKQMVRASRKQALQLIPVADAVAMAMLACPVSQAELQANQNPNNRRSQRSGSDLLEELADDLEDPEDDTWATSGASSARRIKLPAPASSTIVTSSTGSYRKITTYGQLFEALLRGWHMLPLGLYRRRQPVAYPQPPEVKDPALQYMAAFGGIFVPGISVPGGGAFGGAGSGTSGPFRYDKSLLSYVFTNPPAHTILNSQDLVYVLRASSVKDAISGGTASGLGGGMKAAFM